MPSRARLFADALAVRLLVLLALAAAPLGPLGCGGGEGGEGSARPGSNQHGGSCGVAGELRGSQCGSLEDCGPNNAVRVTFCEHCFARADTHVCEAGVCRSLEPATSNVAFSFAVPPEARGSRSFTVASVNPILADGARVSCEGLFSGGCVLDGNSVINARNSRFTALPQGDLVSGLISADPGPGRLLVVQVTEGQQGRGAVKARGCTEVEVRTGETVGPVIIELAPVPTPAS